MRRNTPPFGQTADPLPVHDVGARKGRRVYANAARAPPNKDTVRETNAITVGGNNALDVAMVVELMATPPRSDLRGL